MRLEAKDISFGYAKGQPVLEQVCFHADSGEIVGLTAPSGYGKSTLGKILAGYLTPWAGEVLLDGKRPAAGGYNPVQLVFQHPEKAVNPKWKMKRVLEEAWIPDPALIRRMGIDQSWLNRWPAELSGGELQRFCVLRALSPQTRFLIADEMTTMLDTITQAQIWDAVTERAAAADMGVIVISHDRPLLDRLCSRVVRLDER